MLLVCVVALKGIGLSPSNHPRHTCYQEEWELDREFGMTCISNMLSTSAQPIKSTYIIHDLIWIPQSVAGFATSRNNLRDWQFYLWRWEKLDSVFRNRLKTSRGLFILGDTISLVSRPLPHSQHTSPTLPLPISPRVGHNSTQGMAPPTMADEGVTLL